MKFRIGLPASLVVSVLLAVSYVPAVSAVDIQRLVPFQGRLHGADSQAVSDGHYDLTFYIYDTPTGGTALWTETHANVSVIHGYINVLLGATELMDEPTYANGDPQYDASKSTVDFTSQKYLGVSIDGGAEMFPRSQLVPSFHAFTANHAEHATQADNATNADNADKLGGEEPSNYASASSLQTLDERVTSGFDDLGAGAGGLAERTTVLEAKFTGDKAKNADLFDGMDASGFLLSNFTNGFYGMTDPSGSTGNWIRTTSSGLIPFGSSSAGVSNLGTSTWPFNEIHAVNIYDGGTVLEEKFLGIGSKASDSDKLDNINSTQFARTDVDEEVFDNDIRVVGSDIYIGGDGKGDARLNFWDDDGNTWRTLTWDDSEDEFIIEKDDGLVTTLGGGWLKMYEDHNAGQPSFGTSTFWGTGLYLVVLADSVGGNYVSTTIYVYSESTNASAVAVNGSDVNYHNRTWSSEWGRFIYIYKLTTKLGR